jgi:hypothetical protein
MKDRLPLTTNSKPSNKCNQIIESLIVKGRLRLWKIEAIGLPALLISIPLAITIADVIQQLFE